MPRKKGFLPPTPKWLDENSLLRPSLSMGLYADKLQEEKDTKVKEKKIYKCSNCKFDDGCVNAACAVNSIHPNWKEKKEE